MKVWRKVLHDLEKHGYYYTSDQCDKKMRALKYRYKLIVDGNEQSGRGRRKWEYMYFELMDDLFAGYPSVGPTRAISSFPEDKSQPTTQRPMTPSHKEATARPPTAPVPTNGIRPPTPTIRPTTPTIRLPTPTTRPPTPTIRPQTPTVRSQTPTITPHKKRKIAHSNEPPEWFKIFAEDQKHQLEEIETLQESAIQVSRERNDILKSFTIFCLELEV